jgi:hypothetical protein
MLGTFRLTMVAPATVLVVGSTSAALDEGEFTPELLEHPTAIRARHPDKIHASFICDKIHASFICLLLGNQSKEDSRFVKWAFLLADGCDSRSV